MKSPFFGDLRLLTTEVPSGVSRTIHFSLAIGYTSLTLCVLSNLINLFFIAEKLRVCISMSRLPLTISITNPSTGTSNLSPGSLSTSFNFACRDLSCSVPITGCPLGEVISVPIVRCHIRFCANARIMFPKFTRL